MNIHLKNIVLPLHDSANLELNGQITLGSEGIVTAISGPSGVGKTTLLLAISSAISLKDGCIETEGNLSPVIYVPQTPVMIPNRTVGENVGLFREVKSHRNRFSKEIIEEMADILGVSDLIENRTDIKGLSGGETQRLSLIRALAARPPLLLLDEPFSSLDVARVSRFSEQLRRYVQLEGINVILVTHSIGVVKLVADRVVYISPDNSANQRLESVSVREFCNQPGCPEAAMFVLDGRGSLLTAEQAREIHGIELEARTRRVVVGSNIRLEHDAASRWQVTSHTDRTAYCRNLDSEGVILADLQEHPVKLNDTYRASVENHHYWLYP